MSNKSWTNRMAQQWLGNDGKVEGKEATGNKLENDHHSSGTSRHSLLPFAPSDIGLLEPLTFWEADPALPHSPSLRSRSGAGISAVGKVQVVAGRGPSGPSFLIVSASSHCTIEVHGQARSLP